MEKKHDKIKREWIIPTQWSEVKLSDYTRFLNATKPYEGTPDWSRIAVEKAALYLCGIDSQSLKSLPMREWTEVTEAITHLLQSAKQQPLVSTLRLDGNHSNYVLSTSDRVWCIFRCSELVEEYLG